MWQLYCVYIQYKLAAIEIVKLTIRTFSAALGDEYAAVAIWSFYSLWESRYVWSLIYKAH